MKTCTTCREEKEYDEFLSHSASKDGYGYYCKSCRIKYRRSYLPKARTRTRNSRLVRVYGITHEQSLEMFSEQDGGCAICGTLVESVTKLAVDHNHRTGEVRLLLCHNCNRGLGMFKDDPQCLRQAAAYLEMFATAPA